MLRDNPRQHQLRDIAHKIVVKRTWLVGSKMVMRISKLGSVRPHDGRNASVPERRVVATIEVPKVPLYTEIDL